MFKRQNRLPWGRLNGASSFSAPFFILKVKENNFGTNRFGIVVSKKIDKRAVVRNRIRRLLRGILLTLNSKMTPGHDMLFIVRRGISGSEGHQVDSLIKKVLREAKYIK